MGGEGGRGQDGGGGGEQVAAIHVGAPEMCADLVRAGWPPSNEQTPLAR